MTLTAYCVKCKEKRTMVRAEATFTSTGTPGTVGFCEVCGTKMFKMGRTDDHEGLPVPLKTVTEAAPKERKVVKKAPETAPKEGKVVKKSSKSTTKRLTSKATPEATPATKKRLTTKAATTAAPATTTRRKGKLVIVESPAKARTVSKFLGSGYTVRASVGHVRDLLRSQLSVDVEHDFAPKYRIPNEKREVVKDVKKAADQAQEIYLATDPDREGEAIAWHLVEAAEMDVTRIKRVVFHEITKDMVREAFSHPREIDMERVHAQQARRILDRLVGYQISPILWQKVRSRTSAGRVQSVALRLVVEREHEIDEFESVEYWTIEADLGTLPPAQINGRGEQFRAMLSRINGEKVDLKNRTDTQVIVQELKKATYAVDNVKKGERIRRPAAPFTTSTLQQEASRRLGFGTSKTMKVAQQLYEGIDLGADGTIGLITYMRTDSMTVSTQAQEEARDYVTKQYGGELLPEKPPIYKTKSKSAQEAHEAIRPTSSWREPDKMHKFLSKDQARLYTLIWQRFVASQMANAIYDTMSVAVKAGILPTPTADGPWTYQLSASGSRIRFKGFLAVYEESKDEDAVPDTDEGKILPDLTVGQLVHLLKLLPEQHFTQPPPRFTDATLIKLLEEHGIGRPSTYAPIVSTIQERGYAERVDKRLHPTELGEIINDLLVEYFPDIVDVEFTAKMENDLDRIANGEAEWVPVLNEFYSPFAAALAHAEANMPQISIADEPTGEPCEKCGSPMVFKMGRFGKFQACSNFPNCRNAKPFLVKMGVTCPNDGGEVVERRTKKGRVFYGCANYPDCSWSSWKKPLPMPCPKCQGMLVQKNRYQAKCVACESEFQIQKLAMPEPKTVKPELVLA